MEQMMYMMEQISNFSHESTVFHLLLPNNPFDESSVNKRTVSYLFMTDSFVQRNLLSKVVTL